jgi:Lrp/AsnC family leucine-responsive transcriptional regulator
MIDEISLKILKILQEKARIPNVEVARQVGMAPSAVLERIRKLEHSGIIDGYEVRLNPQHFGRHLVAFVLVKVSAGSQETDPGKAIARIPEVQEVHFVTGEDGYLVKLRVSEPAALQEIIRSKIAIVPEVVSTRTLIALTTLKETSRFPLGEGFDTEQI